MKKLAMIVMLFGFVGSVHADGTSDEPMMLAYDDPDQGTSHQNNEGGAMLKPEPEYDIKLDSDSLCDTDPYSCFHLADNDATVIRTEENLEAAQQAFLILIFLPIGCALGESSMC
ncbi:hypothetical protein [Thioalkalivibrio sp. HK1]|uniref:hypothetical protein n=1 Tax=Thioalkalivibrio sp. HK1 TaxID=1469245 RepID=UPI0004724855|nr:hypothetical protein [Thioalkalivibrio sp. HK1]